MKHANSIYLIALCCLLGACSEPQCLDAALVAPSRPARFAFVASDFTSSVIGVLDARGQIINPPLISSGSAPPGALLALSGDVVLASSQPPDRLLYVERLGADLITEVSREAWFVRQQSRVSELGTDGSTFSANPQDMIPLSDNRYWVTRFNPNIESSKVTQGGNDIAIVSRPGGLIFETIPLSSANTAFENEIIYARPGRMVFTPNDDNPDAGIMTVGLARLSQDFMVAGPGAVAFVDTTDKGVTLQPLSPLTNCSEVRAVPGEPNRVVVVCAGAPFTGPEQRRTTSGLALLDVRSRQVLHLWLASTHADVLPPQHGLVPLGGTQVAVVGLSEGDEATEIESQLIGIDLRTGAKNLIAVSIGESLGLGAGAFDSKTNSLFVPDTNRTDFNTNTVRRFDRVQDLQFIEQIIPPDLICDELPIREITLLSPPSEQ